MRLTVMRLYECRDILCCCTVISRDKVATENDYDKQPQATAE